MQYSIIISVVLLFFSFFSEVNLDKHCESQNSIFTGKLLKCQGSYKPLLATFQSKGCEP